MSKQKSHDREIVTIPKHLEYMIQAIRGSLKQEEKEKLFNCHNDAELFEFLWSSSSAHGVLSLEEEFSAKSESAAKNLREKGNEYFKKQSFLSALNEYGACIIQAPFPRSYLKNFKGDSDRYCVSDGCDDSTALALAYGNRSAALYQLGKYEECLKDIDRALNLNYPSNLIHKLLHRRGSCYAKLQEFDKARQSFQLSLKTIDNPKCEMDDKTKNSWKKTIEKYVTNLSEESETGTIITRGLSTTSDGCATMLVPELTAPAHSKIPEASSLLDLRKDGKGHDAVLAKEEVDIGSVLVVEEPYASVLFAGRLKEQRCYSCFSILPLSPVSCFFCTTVAFCNETCREESYSKFHKFECKYFALFGEDVCSDVGHLVTRIFMILGTERILAHLRAGPSTTPMGQAKKGSCTDELESGGGGDGEKKGEDGCKVNEVNLEEKPRGCDRSKVPETDIHDTIFKLEVGGVRKPSPVNNDEIIPLLELPFFGFFLVKLLNLTGFLKLSSSLVPKNTSDGAKDKERTQKLDAITEENDDEGKTKPKKIINKKFIEGKNTIGHETDFFLLGGFLVSCLRMVKRHAKLIREAKKFGDDRDGLASIILGIGLYPRAVSKVSHSCDPSADVVNYGNVAVIRSIRQLGRGDEVSVSFGPLFHEMKLDPRRKLLWRSYSIYCNCTACYNRWPVLEEMFEEAPGYRCDECRSILTSSDKVDTKFLSCPVCRHKQNLEEIVENLRNSFDKYAVAINDAMSGNYEGALPQLSDHLRLIQRYIRQPWPDLVACQTAVKLCYRLMANRSK